MSATETSFSSRLGEFYGVSGLNLTLAHNREIKARASAFKESLDNVITFKLDGELVTGKPRLGRHQFGRADLEAVANSEPSSLQSFGREVFSKHSPGKCSVR